MRRIPSSAALILATVTAASVAIAQDEAQQGAQEGPSDTPSECAAPRFQAQLITPVAGRIPRDAGVVVGLFPGGSLEDLPAAVQLSRRRRTTALRREVIAPGLYRLTPDARRIWGRWNVDGVEGSPELAFSRPGLPAPPATPRLTRVERYRAVSAGESHTELKAHFDFPTPNGVVAVLSYWGDDDEPDLWARAIPTQTQAVLWRSTGQCSELPPGATAPPREGNVRVAFVDQYGQVSQLSAPQPLSR